MKLLAAFFTLCLLASPAVASPEKYTLDPAHTTVAFLVDHVGYAKTLGVFSEVSGAFSFDSETNEISDLAISVATDSVDSNNEARDKHLRNKDFLNVKKYPEMTFSAAAGSIDSAGRGQIAGELTLLGETRQLVLDVSLNKADKYPFGHKKFTLGVSARGELDRSDYGMDYGVANALVGDAVDLIIEVEAIQE